MLDFGAGTTHGSVEDALVRSQEHPRRLALLGRVLARSCCVAALGRMHHASVLFDAGPLGPMHGHALGARGERQRVSCFDCKPSIGTRVSLSVSAMLRTVT
eukprot:1823472-Prymnesium_polylepis.1